MNVRIIETGAFETLSIIDPASGMDWTQDLLGNHDALHDYNDDIDAYEMKQSEYDWWAGLIDRYQRADDRMYALRQTAPHEEFFTAWASYNISNDLDDMPEQMNQFCDAWESGEFSA